MEDNYIYIMVCIVIIFFIANIYNGIVKLHTTIDSSLSDISVLLKKRFNLIPLLVDTVKGYMKYEQETLEKIVKLRIEGLKALTLEKKLEANKEINSLLKSFFMITESYPDLKANKSFLELQKELSKIENEIANSRRYYNAVVRDYNAQIKKFPNIVIAKIFNFQKKEYFELDDNENSRVNNMPSSNFNLKEHRY